MQVLNRLTGKDNSVKYLLQLHDCNTIEALYMHDRNGTLTYNSTLCVSSQVGCKLGCRFCATGRQAFIRNLSATEILEQVGMCNSVYSPVRAVVFAGMGEPLLNYENVHAALFLIKDAFGIDVFELATVGIVPGIESMIRDFSGKAITLRLNVSLHATTDEMRNMLIPLNKVYGISTVLRAAEQYAKSLDSKVRVRYMLINGLNDTGKDISRLCRLLENKPFKLVISSYNDNSVEGLTAPGKEGVQRFYEAIREKVDSDIFFNFGSDIQGSCGQLRQACTERVV